MSCYCSGSEFEFRTGKREINSACRTTTKRNRASSQRRQGSGDIHVVEVGSYLRRAALPDCYARVSSRTSLENIGREVIELNFAIRRDDTRARLAQVHLAQHAATNAQVGRCAITARRLNYEHRFRELDVFRLT